MKNQSTIKRIIISRTDAIGDVILTFPLCGLIKKHFPGSQIIFLGRTYTKPVIACCEHVSEFVNADELLKDTSAAAARLKELKADAIIHVFPDKEIARVAKRAGIPISVGTTNRLFHWSAVNTLVRLSRKNSPLHEAQLNCILLKGIGIHEVPGLHELPDYTGFTQIPALKEPLRSLLDKTKKNIILHPKSNISAREWSPGNFKTLIGLLDPGKYKIFISGTEQERSSLDKWLKSLPSHVVDLTGKLSLDDFIAFISKADHLVAASTGPLHIAAASGISATGIYPPIKPMHPGRWQPIGRKAGYLCVTKSCSDCRNDPKACYCINEVTAVQVFNKVG